MGEIIKLGQRATVNLPTAADARITVALAVHDLIVALIHTRQGELRDLAGALHERFGGELAVLAEGAFVAIYGCDPYVFAARLSNFQRG